MLRTGLQVKAVDPRTIQYRAIRRAPTWEPPKEWSWDHENPGAPLPMFANDRLGDCVIAARAHQTLRFEKNEQGLFIPITDKEVETEYFKESDGEDSGLVALYAMRAWRNYGWIAGGKLYKIHSFVEVQPQDHLLVQEAMMVGTGLQFGIRLPVSAADQLNAHQVWDLVAGDRGRAGSWGGHMVTGCEYDEEGVTVKTWGKDQKMTWRFVDSYCDECYMAIDARNEVANSAALTDALAEATKN